MSRATSETDRRLRVRIPADVEREDRVLARLTARQVAILAVVGVVLWLVFLATEPLVPVPVFLGAATPIAAAALVLAFGRRDGVTLDRLAWAALRQARRPRRLVTTTSEVVPPPAWVGSDESAPLPAPLRLPARAIAADGTVDLGRDGAAIVLACSTVSFALATDAEQEAMVTGFGAWLNALSGHAQIVIGTQPVDISPLARRVEHAAGGLPHLALENAAREHAQYLAQLAASTDMRTRQVLVVLREPPPPGGDAAAARDAVGRRGNDAIRALRTCGVTARPLPGPEVSRVLGEVSDPHAPAPVGATTQIVTGQIVTGRSTQA